MRRFIEAVVERYRSSPALDIWNLQNEPGKPPCRCPHTLARFVDYLKQRYPDIGALRRAWLGEYQVFDTFAPESLDELDVAFVERAFRFATRGRATPLVYDFAEFAVENLNDNLRGIGALVRALDPAREQHANPASPLGNGIYSGLDEWRMAEALDSISVSVHPSHFFYRVENDEEAFPTAFSFCVEGVRSWADGKDAWIGELQAGTTFFHPNKYTPSADDLLHAVYQSFGRGLRGVLFWEWQSWRSSTMEAGEFGLRRCHDGGPTERSDAVEKAGTVLAGYREAFRGLSRPPAEVAIVASRASKIYKYLQGTEKPFAGNIENDVNYAAYGCFKVLHQANIAVDFLTEDQVKKGGLSRYRAVFLPHAEVMDPETAVKLGDYVRDGGWLWADGRCAFLDTHVYLRDAIPGHGLADVFGCREKDFVAARRHHRFRLVDGTELPPFRFIQMLEPTGGAATATCDGTPVAVRHHYGKGCAELFGTYLTRGLQDRSDTGMSTPLLRFIKDARVTIRDDITSGFEWCMLTGPSLDVYVVSNRVGRPERLHFPMAERYAGVDCPQDAEGRKTFFSGSVVTRDFDRFETVLFLCRKPS